MEFGMLWIDDGEKWAKPTSLRESEAFSRRGLISRVQEAAASYEAQYGEAPSLCLLNPDQFIENEEEIIGLRLEASPSLLPNYFWIGQDSEMWALPTSASERKAFSTGKSRDHATHSRR